VDEVAGVLAPPLGAEAVEPHEPVLGEAAVAAEVPLSGGAGGTGLRVGPPDDADDQVALRQPVRAAGRRGPVRATRARPPAAPRRAALAERAAQQLVVGAADADEQTVDEDGAQGRVGLGEVLDTWVAGAGTDGEGTHAAPRTR
jgi:hypothetical protein